MSGIDFDRQVFVAPAEQPAPQQPRAVGLIILAIAVIGIAFIGYKLLSYAGESGASAESNSLQQIQQELADMKERMDQMEKRHKTGAPESALPPSRSEASVPSANSRVKPAYQISAASALNPQRNPSPAVQPFAARPAPASASVAGSAETDNANREAWKVTSERLADVAGAVGSQQGEIAQTRDQLNQLLAQTRRTALQFELSRGPDRQSVGPVELQLKNTDPKAERYTVCVYVDSKCIELKNRVLDEVVVFVLARGTAPLELVATRISRDEIVGYLEVPSEKVGR
jgi:cell division septum initiation protein DivIVA